MELQENNCPEIALLENYHEAGKRKGGKMGKGGATKGKIPNENPNDVKYNLFCPNYPRKQFLGIFR